MKVTDDLEFPEGSDRCEKEAIRLALKYNFVTDVTSMVVEEDDEYITKKNLEEKEVKQKGRKKVHRGVAGSTRNSNLFIHM